MLAAFESVADLLDGCGHFDGVEERPAVVVGPVDEVQVRPLDPLPDESEPVRGAPQRSNVGQCQLPHRNPRVQHPGMLERVRHQPQAGGVAEPEVPAPLGIEGHRSAGVCRPGAVLHQVVAQLPEHPCAQHLGPIGHPQRMVAGVSLEGAHPVLAVGVERGASQDVAGIGHLCRVGLAPCGEGIDEIVEEANAAIATREHEDTRIESAQLLAGDLAAEQACEFAGWLAGDQRAGDFPPLGDDPVGVLGLVDRRGVRDEAEPAVSGVDLVHRLAVAPAIDVESHAPGLPALARNSAQHGSAEAVASQASRAHHRRLHHHLRRTQAGLSCRQLRRQQVLRHGQLSPEHSHA